jgi:hypothetical protein
MHLRHLRVVHFHHQVHHLHGLRVYFLALPVVLHVVGKHHLHKHVLLVVFLGLGHLVWHHGLLALQLLTHSVHHLVLRIGHHSLWLLFRVVYFVIKFRLIKKHLLIKFLLSVGEKALVSVLALSI